MSDKIWLSSPHLGTRELKYVREAFDTNWIAPIGPHINAFEDDLKSYCNVNHATVLSSGTAAIHLGLKLLGVDKGDQVLCQSFTFSASANPIVYLGANPTFIDSESETWNIDPNFLEEEIKNLDKKGKRPKAILPVHLYGMPAKMDEILSIAMDYEIPVLEDAAEALGSEYKGKKCGSLANLSVLSFNGNKIITTSGGGALLGNDGDLIKKASFLATQARDEAPHYEHTETGYNYRLSNVLAGIGRGQMELLNKRVESRRSNFRRYKKYFDIWNSKGFEIQFQEEPNNYFSNRWLTCILVNPAKNNGLTSMEIRSSLEKGNIESRPLWKPMHLQPVFRNDNYVGNGVAERMFKTGLCLPSGSNMENEHFDRIFGILNELFRIYC